MCIIDRFVWVTALAALLASISGLTASTNVVSIVGLPGGQTQSLPTSYVQNFQRWQINDDGKVERDRTCQRLSVDLEIIWHDGLQVRPAVEFLIKGGVPTYVLAALQFRDADGSPPKTCPLARQWTTFSFAAEPQFRVEVFEQQHDGTAVEWKFGNNPAADMQEALQLFGIVTSQLEQDSPLLEGFNILSVPLAAQWAAVPEPLHESYEVSCLATAEPNAEELLKLQLDLLEITASSLSEMTVRSPTSSAHNTDTNQELSEL